MKRSILLLLVTVLPLLMKAQEFICQVSVNAPSVEGSERKVFQTMQSALYEFINNRKWTNYVYKPEERIECSMMLTITERVTSDQFKGRLNLVLKRPVYKTSYNTNLLNYVDEAINFKYVEYEPLVYNDDAFTSNLTSVVAYYLYVFLGLDADSYSNMGGTPYFEKAKAIVNTAQNASESGWKAFESTKNRFWLVENLLNGAYSPLREGLYQYHRLGLDVMSDNIDLGRSAVSDCLDNFQRAYRQKPGLFILQLMMEAKCDELINIFSQAAPMDKTKAVNILKEIDPSNSSKYQKIMSSGK
ncbi:MAG TPA: DUF4835 family protein [Bacteroidales bacterium]|nr:DUF4835 family protein [Bacteroidales bacterium]HPT02280.1 DUF4835 family protein [Bacteroidales bacterium]